MKVLDVTNQKGNRACTSAWKLAYANHPDSVTLCFMWSYIRWKDVSQKGLEQRSCSFFTIQYYSYKILFVLGEFDFEPKARALGNVGNVVKHDTFFFQKADSPLKRRFLHAYFFKDGRVPLALDVETLHVCGDLDGTVFFLEILEKKLFAKKSLVGTVMELHQRTVHDLFGEKVSALPQSS